jgi:hypothetical protein
MLPHLFFLSDGKVTSPLNFAVLVLYLAFFGGSAMPSNKIHEEAFVKLNDLFGFLPADTKKKVVRVCQLQK